MRKIASKRRSSTKIAAFLCCYCFACQAADMLPSASASATAWVPARKQDCRATCEAYGKEHGVSYSAVSSGTADLTVCSTFEPGGWAGTVTTDNSRGRSCYYYDDRWGRFLRAYLYNCLCARPGGVEWSRSGCNSPDSSSPGAQQVVRTGSRRQLCRSRVSRVGNIVGYTSSGSSSVAWQYQGRRVYQGQRVYQWGQSQDREDTTKLTATPSTWYRPNPSGGYSHYAASVWSFPSRQSRYCRLGISSMTSHGRAYNYEVLCAARQYPPPPPSAACDGPPPGSTENADAWPAACSGPVQAGITCTASCLEGYTGAISSTCSRGEWSQLTGACMPQSSCSGLPPALGQGSWPQSCRNKTAGYKCEAVCDAGFRLPPLPTATCLTSGNWSSISGRCKARDPVPCPGEPSPGVNPPNAQWNGNCADMPHTGVCFAVCNPGFLREPRPSATCEDGMWLPVNGTCQQAKAAETQDASQLVATATTPNATAGVEAPGASPSEAAAATAVVQESATGAR